VETYLYNQIMSVPKVTVIDYGMGNVWSVMSALKYLGAETELISDPDKISKSSILVLPGVGSFRKGMNALTYYGLNEAIIEAVSNREAKILGICLGMQLMGVHSTEDGNTEGLGLISNRVERFSSNELGNNKIPHVGFNALNFRKKQGLFKNLPDHADFYFTHSYRMLVDNLQGNSATCNYGIEFLAAFELESICGTQFHPEKSQTNGLVLLKNYLVKCTQC
jgi:imidazole glycerol-phosphate synthase subunit HisH